MQENIDLGQINDIVQLKALKSDQFERIADANTDIARANINLAAINTRIAQVERVNLESSNNPASLPNGDANEAAGAGHMEAVALDVTPQGGTARE